MSEQSAWQSPSIGERARGAVWLVPLLLAAAELVGHATMRSRVATDDDWRRAGEFVRTRLRPRDQVIAAPAWADPLARRELGATLGLARVGELDLEPYERVFVLSIRGHMHPQLADTAADGIRRFGEVTVTRHDLGPSPVLYDFVANLEQARVSQVVAGQAQDCPRVHLPPRGGGLGQGPYWPADRFVCDPQSPWLFVARTVNEDRDLALRTCVWQHPRGVEPIRATYHDVPLGERIVLDADIYYEHEREEVHGLVPFELRVRVDGHDVGTMRHLDGQGRKRMVITTGERGDRGRTGTVEIETTTAEPHLRTVCWSGSTRLGPREAAR